MTDMALATKQRRVIFVGNINNLEENKIEHLFIPFGPIQSIKKVDNHSFAFVQYEEANDAADAIDNMHNYVIDGKVLTVSLKQLKEESNNSLS